MALRNIVKVGDPILDKKSRTVEKFDEKLSMLIDDMLETMYKENGVGLAAVQVGMLKRVVVIDVGDGPMELVNPEIIPSYSFPILFCINSAFFISSASRSTFCAIFSLSEELAEYLTAFC